MRNPNSSPRLPSVPTPARWMLLLSSALVAFSTAAENWPQFRGPTAQGISSEPELPLHWSATQNIIWTTPVPGESWSSPIVWGDRVFLTTATESGQTCRLLALDARTGAPVWNTAVFEQVPRRKETRNSYATPTPATDGQRVYAAFGDGSFAALNFDGSIAWTNRSYPFYSQHGLGSSPILHQGLLIMTRDASSEGSDKTVGWQKPWDQSYLLALDTATGRERWRASRGLSRIAHGSPTIWKAPDGDQVVSEVGDVVQGFDVVSGRRLWSSEVLGEGKVPSTLIGQGLVFTSGGWGGRSTTKAFKLGGSGDLRETNLVWEQRKGMPNVPSMLHVEPHLFAITDGGIATCLNAATGDIVWQERIGGNHSASPIAGAGRLYFTSDEGVTTVVRAGPKFEVLATNTIPGKLQASLAAAGGRLYLRTDSSLICIGSR